jgi:spore coat polysaccharide biosynthesis protein SpsF
LNGRPVIQHVLNRVAQAVPFEAITVATSQDASDDPLAAYLKAMGVSVFRGPLEDVFARFQLCLKTFPCPWFFRVCADSPLLDGKLFPRMLEERQRDIDLITNVQVRTFPRGQSLELINAETFARIDPATLAADEKEHATKVFYSRPEHFRIVNLVSGDPELAKQSYVVDTIDDLRRLEGLPLPELSL